MKYRYKDIDEWALQYKGDDRGMAYPIVKAAWDAAREEQQQPTIPTIKPPTGTWPMFLVLVALGSLAVVGMRAQLTSIAKQLDAVTGWGVVPPRVLDAIVFVTFASLALLAAYIKQRHYYKDGTCDDCHKYVGKENLISDHDYCLMVCSDCYKEIEKKRTPQD